MQTAPCGEQDDGWGQRKEGESGTRKAGRGPDWVGQREVAGTQMSEEALEGA